MSSVDKAFDKMEKELKKKEKAIKKQRNKDLWAALASLGSVMLLALAIAWLKSGESVVREFVGHDIEKTREIYESTRNVLFGAGFISLLVVIIYIVKRIKYRRKSAKVEEAFIDYDRLDAARARVERARKEKAEGITDAEEASRYDEYINAVHIHKRPEGMSEEEYRRMRKEEYERYMSMDMFDDVEIPKRSYSINQEGLRVEKELTPIERLKEFIATHAVAFGVGAGVVLLGIIAIVVLLLI